LTCINQHGSRAGDIAFWKKAQMPDNRRSEHEKQKEQEAPRMLGPTGKKNLADEELGPERRVEIARRAEAKRLRGRPPSI
jgi:hypothetical protein